MVFDKSNIDELIKLLSMFVSKLTAFVILDSI